VSQEATILDEGQSKMIKKLADLGLSSLKSAGKFIGQSKSSR
jgi:hypothetical protein